MIYNGKEYEVTMEGDIKYRKLNAKKLKGLRNR
jgi:hypothetical protein